MKVWFIGILGLLFGAITALVAFRVGAQLYQTTGNDFFIWGITSGVDRVTFWIELFILSLGFIVGGWVLFRVVYRMASKKIVK